MAETCETCGGAGTDCWIVLGVTTSGEFYNHMHFELVEECPVCNGEHQDKPDEP